MRVRSVALLGLCCVIAISLCSCRQEEPAISFNDEASVSFQQTESESDCQPETEIIVESENGSSEESTVQETPSEMVILPEETVEPVPEEPTEMEITSEEPQTEGVSVYPLYYSDGTCSIVIYREWFEHAWVYAAHLQFTDYTRLATACANGAYDSGHETTSHAAKRLGAVFAVNGCYSAPYLNYTVVRAGAIWNGEERTLWLPAVYSSHNGLLLSAWETGGTPGIVGCKVKDLVAGGLVTDTFCFGPPGMQNGVITDVSMSGERAQRTFIGTNGDSGDIWICVSDGRYNDGESAGLLGNQCMRFLRSKGCVFGVNLDGGGSSAMYFDGEILNAVRGNERAVVDFLYFK